jgi:hypothetical protein
MKKGWIVWIVVLIVIVVVVVVFAKGKGKATPKGGQGSSVAQSYGMFQTSYDLYSKKLLSMSGEGLQRVIGQYRNWTVKGQGWVASAAAQADGSMLVKINADQAATGEPPITVTLKAENAAALKAPLAAGQKVAFQGRIQATQVAGGVVRLTLTDGNATPVKG